MCSTVVSSLRLDYYVVLPLFTLLWVLDVVWGLLLDVVVLGDLLVLVLEFVLLDDDV